MTFPLGLKMKICKDRDISRLPPIWPDFHPMCECGDSWMDHEFVDGHFYCSVGENQEIELLVYDNITPKIGN